MVMNMKAADHGVLFFGRRLCVKKFADSWERLLVVLGGFPGILGSGESSEIIDLKTFIWVQINQKSIKYFPLQLSFN
jgi:hypothetical protein